MENLLIIFRSLFKKGRNNLIKILSLGVGLAVGLVLIAKVYFDQSFDNFFPETDQVYQVQMNFKMGDADPSESNHTSGGLAIGFREDILETMSASRFTVLNNGEHFYTTDGEKYRSDIIMADSCWFDIFPRKMLVGNPREVLARPMYVLISDEIAERLGGASVAVGQTIWIDGNKGKNLTIGGVFERLPYNTHLRYDMIISMESISKFMWDGTENWLGNERYTTYVKLRPGTSMERVEEEIDDMKNKRLPMEEIKKVGLELNYLLVPLHDIYSGSKEVKQMSWLLGLLAFALLATAILNYVLIVISSLVSRSKEMAVHKCYGASEPNILKRMLVETCVDLFASLLLAAVLIFVFQGNIKSLLNQEISVLFNAQSLWVLAGVCVVVFLVSGLLPGYLFSRIPVAAAFRNYSENRRFWKLGLLFVEFIAAGFFAVLLLVIVRQYNFMVNDDTGYNADQIAYCELSGVNRELRQKALDEVGRLAEVAEVSSASSLLFYGASGNNIALPDNDTDMFNVADLYFVGNNYFDMMQIPIIEGRLFREHGAANEVMVSRSFANKILAYVDWTDGVIGKEILISEHSEEGGTFTICGVYENIRIGAIGMEDTRPSIMFSATTPANYMQIKFHQLTAESMKAVEDLLVRLLPDKDIQLYSYEAELLNRYSDSKRFRDQVLIGGLITLIICLIGLLGYTSDEMNRRRKETAIRKVNGATIMDILRLFVTDISRIALPALIIGGMGAALVASRWMQQFPQKADVSILTYLCCGVVVFLIILCAVAIKSFKAAVDNPAESVKSE
ncbi:putative ABC transport system permease protein [Parabacteroides sp. PFB2-12]|uniref:ABC transporter permease n=1 Tax=unclassified Parabacteroides TaxID=2649774 RepID=UPI0024735CA6|nr:MULTISPECIES: ABC transporter permease [unclassified Parabacteroides]MDH6342077.1 putative ABC transport system permease protein [Parabacteroides sp. PM6-13]MDH6389496.1 putative ABC transport system permease protein [Parabacteroides sp. PFB2-12]